MKNKDKIINLLLERIATLEYELERENKMIGDLQLMLKSHKDLEIISHYKNYYVEIEQIYYYLEKIKGSDF